jgi:hypothetical protein
MSRTIDGPSNDLLSSSGRSRAGAQVRSVTVAGDRAEVTLTVNGHYDYWMYFQRNRVGWEERASGNGPTPGWEDPSAMQW